MSKMSDVEGLAEQDNQLHEIQHASYSTVPSPVTSKRRSSFVKKQPKRASRKTMEKRKRNRNKKTRKGHSIPTRKPPTDEEVRNMAEVIYGARVQRLNIEPTQGGFTTFLKSVLLAAEEGRAHGLALRAKDEFIAATATASDAQAESGWWQQSMVPGQSFRTRIEDPAMNPPPIPQFPLMLEGRQLGASAATALVHVLRKPRRYGYDALCLARNCLANEGAVAIARLIRVHKRITHLDLSSNNMGALGCAAIAKALQRSAVVTLFLGAKTQNGFSRNLLGKEGAHALGSVLLTQQKWHKENLAAEAHMTVQGGRAVSAAVLHGSEDNSALVAGVGPLKSGWSTSNGNGVQQTAKSKKALLRHLSLAGTSAISCKVLVDMKAFVSTTLHSVDLSHNSMGNDVARALCTQLTSAPALVRLSLDANDLCETPNGLGTVIATLISRSKSLHSLSLAHNKFTNRLLTQMAPIFQRLRCSCSLKSLNLNGNCLGGYDRVDCSEAWSQVFGDGPLRLTSLSLAHCELRTCTALALVLKSNKVLRRLNASNNSLGRDTHLLFDALCLNLSVEWMHLGGNVIGDTELLSTSFLRFIKENRSLETLVLRDNNLGDEFGRKFLSLLLQILGEHKVKSRAPRGESNPASGARGANEAVDGSADSLAPLAVDIMVERCATVTMQKCDLRLNYVSNNVERGINCVLNDLKDRFMAAVLKETRRLAVGMHQWVRDTHETWTKIGGAISVVKRAEADLTRLTEEMTALEVSAEEEFEALSEELERCIESGKVEQAHIEKTLVDIGEEMIAIQARSVPELANGAEIVLKARDERLAVTGELSHVQLVNAAKARLEDGDVEVMELRKELAAQRRGCAWQKRLLRVNIARYRMFIGKLVAEMQVKVLQACAELPRGMIMCASHAEVGTLISGEGGKDRDQSGGAKAMCDVVTSSDVLERTIKRLCTSNGFERANIVPLEKAKRECVDELSHGAYDESKLNIWLSVTVSAGKKNAKPCECDCIYRHARMKINQRASENTEEPLSPVSLATLAARGLHTGAVLVVVVPTVEEKKACLQAVSTNIARFKKLSSEKAISSAAGGNAHKSTSTAASAEERGKNEVFAGLSKLDGPLSISLKSEMLPLAASFEVSSTLDFRRTTEVVHALVGGHECARSLYVLGAPAVGSLIVPCMPQRVEKEEASEASEVVNSLPTIPEPMSAKQKRRASAALLPTALRMPGGALHRSRAQSVVHRRSGDRKRRYGHLSTIDASTAASSKEEDSRAAPPFPDAAAPSPPLSKRRGSLVRRSSQLSRQSSRASVRSRARDGTDSSVSSRPPSSHRSRVQSARRKSVTSRSGSRLGGAVKESIGENPFNSLHLTPDDWLLRNGRTDTGFAKDSTQKKYQSAIDVTIWPRAGGGKLRKEQEEGSGKAALHIVPWNRLLGW